MLWCMRHCCACPCCGACGGSCVCMHTLVEHARSAPIVHASSAPAAHVAACVAAHVAACVAAPHLHKPPCAPQWLGG
eukprot:360650-Chlamydomonas_euryale.AAC.1